MRFTILLFGLFFSQFSWGFQKGDMVVVSMEKDTGPYTIQGCYLENGERVCMPKELGYFVHSEYLRLFLKSSPNCKFKLGDDVAITWIGYNGIYRVEGVYIDPRNGCVNKLEGENNFTNEEWLRKVE
jgi:hypothetical protein